MRVSGESYTHRLVFTKCFYSYKYTNGKSVTEISDNFFRFPIDNNRKTCYHVITTEKPVKHEGRFCNGNQY